MQFLLAALLFMAFGYGTQSCYRNSDLQSQKAPISTSIETSHENSLTFTSFIKVKKKLCVQAAD